MVFKKFQEPQTSFDIDIEIPLKFKVSLSSEKSISEMSPHLQKAMNLSSTKEIFEKLLTERLKKHYPSKYECLKSCPHYRILENEAKFKIKSDVCEGNISKALVGDFLKECDKHEI